MNNSAGSLAFGSEGARRATGHPSLLGCGGLGRERAGRSALSYRDFVASPGPPPWNVRGKNCPSFLHRGRRGAQAGKLEEPRRRRGQGGVAGQGPLEEVRRARRRRRSGRRPERAPGRPPGGSAPAGARRRPRRAPTPRSAVAATRSARRRPPGRAGKSARPGAPGAAGRPAPPPGRRAEALPRRACPRCDRAGAGSPAPAPPPRPPGPGPPAGSPRISSGSASSPRTVVETTCVSGSWATSPTVPPSSAGPWSRTSRPPTSISPLTSPP